MRQLSKEPFLWIHASGIATLPLWMGLMLVGMGTGDPFLPVGLEKFFLELAVLPAVWMQSQRPFYIFSLLAVALPPDHLDEERRRILAGFQQSLYRYVVMPLVAVILVGYVGWGYEISSLFAPLSPIHQAPGSRLMGGLIALAGILGLSLFSQVATAVGLLLMQPDRETQAWDPLSVQEIQENFSIPGRMLPRLDTWFPRWDPSTSESQTEGEAEALSEMANEI